MNKKFLYCNGDSWTYGEEILGENHQLHVNEKYYNTWPWFLSQELDIPVCVNDAVGAGSNDRIYRKTYQFIKDYIRKGKDPKQLLIVIGWTTPERGEIGISSNDMDVEYIRLTSQVVLNPSGSLNKTTMGDIKTYRDNLFNLYSENSGIQKQLMFMDNLRFLCKQFEIEYYDFVAIGYWPPKITEKAREIKVKLYNFYMIESFNNAVQNNNWTIHPLKHPTPESHKKWANVLKNFIL